VPRIVAWRPDHHHHPAREEADGLKPILAVIEAIILRCQCASGKNLRGVFKVDLSLDQRLPALAFVKSDLRVYVYTKNSSCQYFM
jgi:hypothetical protein